MGVGRETNSGITAEELRSELSSINPEIYERSRSVREYPRLVALNESSLQHSPDSFKKIRSQHERRFEGTTNKLPNIDPLCFDLAEACKNRYSPEMDFVLGKVSQQQLATLLQEAASSFSFRSDLDETYINKEPSVSIYGCFYNVEGIPNGAYSYDQDEHALIELRPGDHRLQLQSGLSLDNVNLMEVPISLHVAGNKDFYKTELGTRGYRIHQMEAGMLVQRLLITASAIGMGGHPLLGFDTKLSDELYKIDSSRKTCLIQIPIGFYRQRSWLKGSLHS